MARKRAAAEEPGDQVHHLFVRHEPPDIEHVPFVVELVERGLANAVAWSRNGEPTHFRILPAGQQIINDTMKRNGEKRRRGRT